VKTLQKVGDMIRNSPVAAPVPLSQGKTATASSSWSAEYGPDKAVDGEESTRWGAANGSRDGWLAVDLGQECAICRVVIKEIACPRTQEFAVEWQDGGTWKELARGTTIGEEKTIDFMPAKARHVRLNILKSSDVPTIEEFQVFAPGAKAAVAEEGH